MSDKYTYLHQLPDEAELIHRSAQAVKAIGNPDEGRVGGYLVAWGNPSQRDLHGEYFTPDTDFSLDWYPRRPALFHHGLDGTMKSTLIGAITSIKADDVGLWAEAQLDMHSKYVQAIMQMVKQGALGWSSGSLPHLVEVDNAGHIRKWPIVEGSLTPTPAEPFRTTVGAIKSLIEIEVTVTPAAEDAKEPETAREQTASGLPTDHQEQISEDDMEPREMINGLLAAILQSKPEWTLTEEEASAIAESVLSQLAAADAQMAAPAPTAGAQVAFTGKAMPALMGALVAHFNGIEQEEARVKSMFSQAVESHLANIAPPKTAAAPLFTSNGAQKRALTDQPAMPRVTEMRSKYADLSPEDMSFYMMQRNAIRRRNNLPTWVPESSFLRELADKAGKAYEAGNLRFGGQQETAEALKSINFMKANELDTSTQANYGDEWVPDLWASQLWEKARMENVILPLFQNVEMPSNPYEYPIESADPTVYFVSENADQANLNINSGTTVIPASKVGSGKVQMNAKKLALRVGFSAELVEDSIIGVTAQYRKQAQRAIQDAIDNVLLNGDTVTTASTNINLIDGTPGGTEKYLALNGLRKLWTVTTTANGVDAGGAAVTLTQLRSARFTLDRAYSANPDNLAIITHPEAYAKLLGLSEFITMDKAGNLATAMTGQIGFVDGMPVLVSAEYPLTNSAGKIPGAGGTLGSFTIAYKPGWYVGFRRRINVSVDFLPYYDSYQLTATVRLAFVNRDNEVAAGVYNALV